MTPYPVLDDLALVVGAAAAALVLGRDLRIPPVLSYMLGGLVLGPMTGMLPVSGSLDIFSELGVALLLFVVGLELNLDKLRAFGRTAAVAGTVQVLTTAVLGAGLARLLGFSREAAVVVGLVTAFSSTAVVVKLLDQAGEMESPHGRLALGILLVQDVLVVVVLTVLGGPGGATGASRVAVFVPLCAMAGLVLLGVAAGRWLLPRLVRWLGSTPQGLFVVGLTWAFGFIVAAERLHLSVELGAFIAGVILAQVPHTDELRRRTHPMVDFFLAIFFVSLGARIHRPDLAGVWPGVLVTSLFVLLAKPIIIAVVLGVMGQPRETATVTGIMLGQVSEFAFILAGLATARGIVGGDFFGFVGLVGLTTIGTSAVVVPAAVRIVERLRATGALGWLPGSASPKTDMPTPLLGNHIVVVGMNTLGRMLVRRFTDLGEAVLAVDTDAGKLTDLRARTLVGDITRASTLEEAAVRRAGLVVSTLHIEDVNALLAYRCARLGVPTSIHAFDTTLVDELLEMGVDHVMLPKHDGIRGMEEELIGLGVVGP